MTQASISKIESSDLESGNDVALKIAVFCGISPDAVLMAENEVLIYQIDRFKDESNIEYRRTALST